MFWMVLAACNVSLDIGPTGPPVDELRDLSGFERIRVASSVDLDVARTDGDFEVKVTGPDGELASVLTTIEGATLSIDSAPGIHGSRQVSVRMPKLTALQLDSTGDASVDDLAGGPLTVRIAGPGDLQLHGTVGELTANLTSTGGLVADRVEGPVHATLSGPGDLSVLDGVLSKAQLVTSSTGSIQVRGVVAKMVELTTTGPGDITVSGTTDKVRVRVGATGRVDASTLKAKRAIVHSDGPGDAQIQVSEYVEGELKGLGDLVVTGGAGQKVASTGQGKVVTK